MKDETQEAAIFVALMSFTFLIGYTNFARSRIYVLMAQEGFPSPLKIGKSCRWVKAEVDDWIAQRKDARDGLTTATFADKGTMSVGGKNVR